MKRILNIDKWDRKEHFQFFNQFAEPFFGICSRVDCTKAYQFCKNNDHSFFLYYLHKTLKATNQIQEFRYRIENDEVYIHDKVDASPTINRPNGTFGFAYIPYSPKFEIFAKQAKKAIEQVQSSNGLKPAASGENVIHFSAIPWIYFSSISHARNYEFPDSCPKISVGKMTEKNNCFSMPVSVHVHHGLVDGKHVGKFYDLFQNLMNGEA